MLELRRLINIIICFISIPVFAISDGCSNPNLKTILILMGSLILIISVVLLFTENIVHFSPYPHIAKHGEWKVKHGMLSDNFGTSIYSGKKECRECKICGSLQFK